MAAVRGTAVMRASAARLATTIDRFPIIWTGSSDPLMTVEHIPETGHS